MDRQAKRTVWLGTGKIAQRFGLTSETVRQWIVRGTNTPGGVVRLRAIQAGNRFFVRRRWLREYLAALDAARGIQPAAPPVEPADKQQERASEAKRRLQERLGRRKRT